MNNVDDLLYQVIQDLYELGGNECFDFTKNADLSELCSILNEMIIDSHVIILCKEKGFKNNQVSSRYLEFKYGKDGRMKKEIDTLESKYREYISKLEKARKVISKELQTGIKNSK